MKRITARLLCVATGICLTVGSNTNAETLGTAFMYQGQLKEGGVPADGEYDFVFRLFDALSGPAQVGSDVPVNNRTVSNGLFAVEQEIHIV